MRLANDTSKTTDAEILTYVKTYYHELSEMAVIFKPKKSFLW